jgi:hypothetical protein
MELPGDEPRDEDVYDPVGDDVGPQKEGPMQSADDSLGWPIKPDEIGPQRGNPLPKPALPQVTVCVNCRWVRGPDDHGVHRCANPRFAGPREIDYVTGRERAREDPRCDMINSGQCEGYAESTCMERHGDETGDLITGLFTLAFLLAICGGIVYWIYRSVCRLFGY